MEKNQYVNKILKECAEEQHKKYYYKRTGNCNYKKCMSACCRFNCQKHRKKNSKQQYQMSDYSYIRDVSIISDDKYDFYISPRLCMYLTFDGLCKSHKKKLQPRVCQYFPMHPDDGTFIALRKICGYKFNKIKNKKYKSKAKREKEEVDDKSTIKNVRKKENIQPNKRANTK